MKSLEALAQEGRINEDASIRDRQSIIINAPLDTVWEVLMDIGKWPEWNPVIKSVKYEKVAEGEIFEWATRHSHVTSQFQRIQPKEVVSWISKTRFVKAIYVWNLEASDNQTIVTVEESIEGLIIPIITNHSKIHGLLMDWLEALKKKTDPSTD